MTLTQTAKKTLEHKKQLVENVRTSIDEFKYVWLFSVGDMRNEGLKDVRKAWKGTGRIVYGKNKVIAKALGETPEVEYKTGLSQVAKVSSMLKRSMYSIPPLTRSLIVIISVSMDPSVCSSLPGISPKLKLGSMISPARLTLEWALLPLRMLPFRKVRY